MLSIKDISSKNLLIAPLGSTFEVATRRRNRF